MRPPAITTAAVDARGPTVAHVHSRTLLSSGGQASREAGAPWEASAGSVMRSQKGPETHGQPGSIEADSRDLEGWGDGLWATCVPKTIPHSGCGMGWAWAMEGTGPEPLIPATPS